MTRLVDPWYYPLETALLAALVLIAILRPTTGAAWFRRCETAFCRLARRPRLSLAAAGLGLIAVLGYERIVLGVRLAGRPIVLLAILAIVVGVQFVSIGLLGEMLVRTYHESQAKPIYRVREVVEPARQAAGARQLPLGSK